MLRKYPSASVGCSSILRRGKRHVVPAGPSCDALGSTRLRTRRIGTDFAERHHGRGPPLFAHPSIREGDALHQDIDGKIHWRHGYSFCSTEGCNGFDIECVQAVRSYTSEECRPGAHRTTSATICIAESHARGPQDHGHDHPSQVHPDRESRREQRERFAARGSPGAAPRRTGDRHAGPGAVGPAHLGDRPLQLSLHLLHAEGRVRQRLPIPAARRPADVRGNHACREGVRRPRRAQDPAHRR